MRTPTYKVSTYVAFLSCGQYLNPARQLTEHDVSLNMLTKTPYNVYQAVRERYSMNEYWLENPGTYMRVCEVVIIAVCFVQLVCIFIVIVDSSYGARPSQSCEKAG
ncbi:hypothetical protein BJ170DRAFT_729429 [Xylariales sp. AK1849]|nr:hypothetical protein BJ170DRAFT_729429 [Xylariales sp. AK1849]